MRNLIHLNQNKFSLEERVNQLICIYGTTQVFKALIDSRRNYQNVSVELHIKNLVLTYGRQKVVNAYNDIAH